MKIFFVPSAHPDISGKAAGCHGGKKLLSGQKSSPAACHSPFPTQLDSPIRATLKTTPPADVRASVARRSNDTRHCPGIRRPIKTAPPSRHYRQKAPAVFPPCLLSESFQPNLLP